MVECETIRIAAMAIADGDAPIVPHDTIEQHLGECESCRNAIAELDIPNLLPSDLQRVAPPSDLWSEVGSTLRDEHSKPQQTTHPVRSQANTKSRVPMIAVVACLLFMAGAGVTWTLFRGDTVDDLIVLAPVPEGSLSKPRMPFSLEAEADVIAIAVMGRRHSRGGQPVIRMQLVEVLKGGQQVGPLESGDGFAPFGCIVPKNPRRFSDMYREGERVSVYLKNADSGWSTLQMTPLTAENEPQWKADVELFLDVLLAPQTDDPEQRYEQLLAANTAGRPHLTDASFYALNANPDSRAAGVLRGMLIAEIGPSQHAKSARSSEQPIHKALESQPDANPPARTVDQQSTLEQPTRSQQAQQQGVDAEQLEMQLNAQRQASFPNRPVDVVQLLAKMKDAESATFVIDYIPRLADSERAAFLEALPGLCHEANANTLSAVRGELKKLAELYSGDKKNRYYLTLTRVRASIDELLKNAVSNKPSSTQPTATGR